MPCLLSLEDVEPTEISVASLLLLLVKIAEGEGVVEEDCTVVVGVGVTEGGIVTPQAANLSSSVRGTSINCSNNLRSREMIWEKENKKCNNNYPRKKQQQKPLISNFIFF